MKKIVPFICLFSFFALINCAPRNEAAISAEVRPAVNYLTDHFAARDFAEGSLTESELDQIIHAGIRAPSSGNRQPWHFTVVQSEDLARQLVPQTSQGNVIIVVSAAGDGLTEGPVILDSALAVHSIYLAAQSLGLGSRIYTNYVANINRSYKTQLGLAEEYSVIAVVRIGRLPAGTDASSSASPRYAADQMVTYR